MDTMFKIMKSGFRYDGANAQQMRNLYFEDYKNVPCLEIAGMVFYELKDMLTLSNLAQTKQDRLRALQKGAHLQLFNVGRDTYLYAVRLTDVEENAINDLLQETAQLHTVNGQIEATVGHLLQAKKEHEKNIEKLKKNFK